MSHDEEGKRVCDYIARHAIDPREQASVFADMTRILARYDALMEEHGAGAEVLWRGYLRKMKPIDPDWSQDLHRLHAAHDKVEELLYRT